jgi:hypothetical protein
MTDHLIQVNEVRHVRGYTLRVWFSNGAVRDVDLAEELWGEMFEPLKDPAFFAKAYVDPETCAVTWPNGADVAPDTLFAMGKDTGQEAA